MCGPATYPPRTHEPPRERTGGPATERMTPPAPCPCAAAAPGCRGIAPRSRGAGGIAGGASRPTRAARRVATRALSEEHRVLLGEAEIALREAGTLADFYEAHRGRISVSFLGEAPISGVFCRTRGDHRDGAAREPHRPGRDGRSPAVPAAPASRTRVPATPSGGPCAQAPWGRSRAAPTRSSGTRWRPS